MNDQLRALEFQAWILCMDRVANHIHLARIHPQNRTYHLMEAWEAAANDYFGHNVARELETLIAGQREAVAA